MKPVSLGLIILITFSFNLSTAIQYRHMHTIGPSQDSIYRIWKFKKIEIPQNFGGGMFYVENYDTWNLMKKGVLSFSVADSPGVFHTIPYKLINNAIVLQFPDKQNNVDVQYKIQKLTTSELQLIMHITFNDQGKIQDLDMVQLDFEPKE